MFFYVTLAEGPGVARDKKFKKKFKKLFRMFFSPLHSPATPECPQKISAQSVQLFGRL